MARTAFRLAGADTLLKKMEALSDKQILAASKKGLKSTIPDLYFNIVSRIPVDTGELKSKMETYGPKVNRKKFVVHGGVMTPTREALGISSDDPNYWPSALEYGSRAHTISKRGKGVLGGIFVKRVRHPGTAPVAFMRNGADASKTGFETNLAREINKTIKKAEKDMNRGGK